MDLHSIFSAKILQVYPLASHINMMIVCILCIIHVCTLHIFNMQYNTYFHHDIILSCPYKIMDFHMSWTHSISLMHPSCLYVHMFLCKLNFLPCVSFRWSLWYTIYLARNHALTFPHTHITIITERIYTIKRICTHSLSAQIMFPFQSALCTCTYESPFSVNLILNFIDASFNENQR